MAACSRPDDRSQVQQYLASCTSDGALGVGIYQEGGGGLEEINAGSNVGVGVKIAVAGSLRMRLDYRVFTLRGSPQYERHQRLYAGLNLGF